MCLLGVLYLIKSVQKYHFSNDTVTYSKKSRYLQSIRARAQPFRKFKLFLFLSQSNPTYEMKHPILLPKKWHFTNILKDHFHKTHLHVRPRTLQSSISPKKYWIISARGAIRSRTMKCIAYFRVSPTNRQPRWASCLSIALKLCMCFIQ